MRQVSGKCRKSYQPSSAKALSNCPLTPQQTERRPYINGKRNASQSHGTMFFIIAFLVNLNFVPLAQSSYCGRKIVINESLL